MARPERRGPQAEFEESYREPLDTLYRDLHLWASTKLADKFGQGGYDGHRRFIELANILGQNRSIESFEHMSSPERIFKLLEHWSQQPGTTVGVLRTIFESLNRDDAVCELDRLRLKKVLVIISMKRNHEVIHSFQANIPGSMELVEYIRPQMNRRYGLKIATNHQLVIRMDRREGIWSSPASKFAGRQLNLYMDSFIYPIPRRNTEPTDAGRTRSVQEGRIVTRRGVTYYEDQSLFFGYTNTQDEPAHRRGQVFNLDTDFESMDLHLPEQVEDADAGDYSSAGNGIEIVFENEAVLETEA